SVADIGWPAQPFEWNRSSIASDALRPFVIQPVPPDQPGGDAVDADAMPAVFQSRNTREVNHCGLRCTVMRMRPGRLSSLDGADQDDRPATALTHRRCSSLNGREASGEIRVDDLTPLGHRHGGQLSGRLHPGIRYDSIQAAESFDGCGHQVPTAVGISD